MPTLMVNESLPQDLEGPFKYFICARNFEEFSIKSFDSRRRNQIMACRLNGEYYPKNYYQ